MSIQEETNVLSLSVLSEQNWRQLYYNFNQESDTQADPARLQEFKDIINNCLDEFSGVDRVAKILDLMVRSGCTTLERIQQVCNSIEENQKENEKENQ